MNESSTNSSSSAAAVAADSASSAAAGTKSAAASAAATSVKLIIKASNQQFDDQIIESDLLWTVMRLKTQLSLVYPSKPAVSEQKLIYSGQLLNDTLLLKDVIRSYKDVYTQNHIFHLVCASKNMPSLSNLSQKSKAAVVAATIAGSSTITSTTSTNDGLRYRNVAGSSAQQQSAQMPQQHQQQNNNINNIFNSQFIPQMMAANVGAATNIQCPNFNPNNTPNMMPFSFPAQFQMQSLATQQVAMYNWMQQVYSQYMDQCIRLSNNTALGLPPFTGSGTASANVQSPLNAAAQFPANPFLQQMPFITSSAAPTANFAAGVSSLNAGSTSNPVIQFPNPAATAQAAVAAASTASTAQAPQAAAEVEQQAPAVAAAAVGAGGDQQAAQLQRFPNIAQDEPENNDWLDRFFALTRLAIFLTILFFNTSPLRCLIVVIIAGGIYLYHIGVFRTRAERNNNNINRNNNDAAAAANQIRQGVAEVQQAQAQQQQQNVQPQAEEDQPNAEAVQREEVPPAEPANGNVNASLSSEPLLAAATATEANTETNQTTTVVSFIRTFVVSFFTSLLPETPAL